MNNSKENYSISVSNGILDKKHIKAIGSAIWEYLWCLDKITIIDENQIGWLLWKKPIVLKEISKQIGKARINISKNLSKLELAGYLKIITAPHGLIIGVTKAKKWFNNKIKPKEKTKKAYCRFGDFRMYYKEEERRWYVIHGKDDFREFTGDINKDIYYK